MKNAISMTINEMKQANDPDMYNVTFKAIVTKETLEYLLNKSQTWCIKVNLD